MKLKYILALADTIRLAAQSGGMPFTPEQIDLLADFCARNHSGFDKKLWLRYIRDGSKPH